MTRLRLTHSRDGRYLATHVTFGKSRFMWMPGAILHQPTLVATGLGCIMAMLDAEGHPSIIRNDSAKSLAKAQSKFLK